MGISTSTFNAQSASAILRRDLSRASAASLCALLWDWAITLDDEVELIWTKNHGSWIKWAFLFARYFAIAVQLCNRSLDFTISSGYDLNRTALYVWYVCQVLVAAFSSCALEIVLMTRVYALYNQERWIRTLFFMLVTLENMIMVAGLVLTLPGRKFQPIDIITHVPPSFAYYGICTIVVQSIILTFTLIKYIQCQWKRIPLLRLLIRDGTLAFATLSIFCIIMVVYTLNDLSFSVTGYAWLLTAVSCTSCRLIINMQRLPIQPLDHTNASTGIEFTTFFTDQLDHISLGSLDSR